MFRGFSAAFYRGLLHGFQSTCSLWALWGLGLQGGFRFQGFGLRGLGLGCWGCVLLGVGFGVAGFRLQRFRRTLLAEGSSRLSAVLGWFRF